MRRILSLCVLCLIIIFLSACGETDGSDRAVLTPQPPESSGSLNNSIDEYVTSEQQGDTSAIDGLREEAENNSYDNEYISSDYDVNATTEEQVEKNENDLTESNVNSSTNTDIYIGEYNDYAINEPMLEIQKNDDETYKIQIGIFRLIQLYDCVGYATEDGIQFSTTEWGDDREIRGMITFESDIATVTFISGWSDFSNIVEYEYYKTSDIPNIYVPEYMN